MGVNELILTQNDFKLILIYLKDGEATVSFFSLCFVYYLSSLIIHSTPFRSYKFPHSVSNVLPTFVALLKTVK